MSRRRKAQLVPVREPNGRLLRSLESALDARSPGEVRRLRDAALRGMQAPEWGTELGRLYLEGRIGPVLFETGKRLAQLMAACHAALGSPREVSPSSLVFKLARRAADPASPEGERQARHERRIVAAMREAVVVLDGFGKRRAVMALLEEDRAPVGEAGLDDIRVGLGCLAQHWGLLDLRGARESA